MERIIIPAPTGGLNLRDEVGSMPSVDCIRLTNMVPRPLCLQTRKGTYPFSFPQVPFDSKLSPLATFAPHPNGKVVIGASGGLFIFDSKLSVYTGLQQLGFTTTTGVWQWVQHSNKIILTNGVDIPIVYDGTTMANLSAIGAGTGGVLIDMTKIWGCANVKGRMFYWYRNAQSFWYATVDGGYQGTLAEFSIATFAQKAGNLIAIATLTNDGGNGVDDFSAFIFDSGEVLLYQGDDPGLVDSWQQVGRFQIPPPDGPLGWAINGVNTVVATSSGPVDLGTTLQAGPIDNSTVIGNTISSTLLGASARSQLLFIPSERFMVWSRFAGDPATQAYKYYVMDLDSRRWCEFYWETPGGNPTVSGYANGKLWMGDSDGFLYSYSMTLGSQDWLGGNITPSAIPFRSFSGYGALGDASRKTIVGAAPRTDTFTATGISKFGFEADFADVTRGNGSSSTLPSQNGAIFQNEAMFSIVKTGFRFAMGLEFYLAPLQLNQVNWYQSDVLVKPGGKL